MGHHLGRHLCLGQIANQLNLAFANINTVVQADTTGTAKNAGNRLTILRTNSVIYVTWCRWLVRHGGRAAWGQGTVGKGLVEFDQKAVDDETGAYNYTGNGDADVVQRYTQNNVISVIADYSDDLFRFNSGGWRRSVCQVQYLSLKTTCALQPK